jgi:hypothetical protein
MHTKPIAMLIAKICKFCLQGLGLVLSKQSIIRSMVSSAGKMSSETATNKNISIDGKE